VASHQRGKPEWLLVGNQRGVAVLDLGCVQGGRGEGRRHPFPRVSPEALGHHCKGKFLVSLNKER